MKAPNISARALEAVRLHNHLDIALKAGDWAKVRDLAALLAANAVQILAHGEKTMAMYYIFTLSNSTKAAKPAAEVNEKIRAYFPAVSASFTGRLEQIRAVYPELGKRIIDWEMEG